MELIKKIKKIALARSTNLPENLLKAVSVSIEEICCTEIVELPYVIAKCVDPYSGAVAGEAVNDSNGSWNKFLESLVLANIYGWAAYSIYDDALDGECPSHIPAANYFLRELTAIYSGMEAEAPGIAHYFRRMMNEIDDANAWECENCRIGESGEVPRPLPFSKTYDPLGSRSIGHALPAIAILLRTGFVDTAQTASLKNFFLDYLTARQLHDDARDWEDDLKRGSINGVSNELLRISGLEIFSRESLPVLRKIFERKVKKWSVAHINSRINRSRKNLHKITAFKNTEPLERMLKRLEI